MKEAKKKAQITDQICRQAQLMRKAGANQTEIGKLLGINPCTVSRMEAAGFDLAVYEENRKLRREKEEARKLLKQQTQGKEQPKVQLVYDPSIAEEYRREQEAKRAEEQVPGQMRMEIPEKSQGVPINVTYADEINREYPENVKMMRFLAGRFDVIEKSQALGVEMIRREIDKLNDTLRMILRAVRGD